MRCSTSGAHRLIKLFAALHIDPLAFQRAEGVDGEIVAAGVQAPGQRRQRLAFDVDHGTFASDRAFGRAADIQQDRHRQIACLGAGLHPDAFVALATGAAVHLALRTAASMSSCIAVQMAAGHHAARAQRLELAFDGADAAGGGGSLPNSAASSRISASEVRTR